MAKRINTWVICPECRAQLDWSLAMGWTTDLKCPKCRRPFKAYVGDAFFSLRRPQGEQCKYYLLLSGRRGFPKPVWFTDAKPDEIKVRYGDRVVLTFRYSTPSVIQNLSLSTFWPIYRGSMAGCFSVIACLMTVAGILACTVVLIRR